MKLHIPERGINLANHPESQQVAQQVSLWIMAQGVMPANREFMLCEKLSRYALGMSDMCWIKPLDYHTLVDLDQPEHYFGRNINGDQRRESIQEFINWFRREYTKQNPEFLFEILDT